jgi:hypothetical protein
LDIFERQPSMAVTRRFVIGMETVDMGKSSRRARLLAAANVFALAGSVALAGSSAVDGELWFAVASATNAAGAGAALGFISGRAFARPSWSPLIPRTAASVGLRDSEHGVEARLDELLVDVRLDREEAELLAMRE